MTPLPPLLETFFLERLQRQRRASPHTIASYRDAFRLLLHFAEIRLGKSPSSLVLSDIDAAFVTAFLDHLETERGNGPRSRNVRLAAVRSFFRFASAREPAHSGLIQRVLDIPQKRFDRNLVAFLTRDEIDALRGAVDTSTWRGRRDYALLTLAVQTGLRVSELVGLRTDDFTLDTTAHVRCRGKGRKERGTPLTRQTAALLRAWIVEDRSNQTDVVFPNRRGAPLSRDAVERLVAKYTTLAARRCPSLARKRVTPHVLRHSAAVALLQAGVDRTVIALWLGHESVETTQMYLDADLATKERALARITPHRVGALRFRPRDSLLAFLEAL